MAGNSILVINAAGAAPRLSSQGSYTLFAPTDAAFRLLPAATRPANCTGPGRR